MTTLYFKYGTYSGTTLSWSASQTLKAVKYIEYHETERIQETDIRGEKYNHQLSKRPVWEIVISANELANATKWTFVQNFFLAHAWKFSTDNWSTEKIVELGEAGRIPVEFLEGHKNMRQVKFTLNQKESD